MSNICKTVTLRTRKIKKGTQLSFYLDYYPGYRDESTMKVQRHESLGIYIFAKPKNQRERDYNERMTEKAEALRCRRYESIVKNATTSLTERRRKAVFSHGSRRKPTPGTPNGRTSISISKPSAKGNAPSAR